jgi:hypothetical protein
MGMITEITSSDIICAKFEAFPEHEGNMRFHRLIRDYVIAYQAATTKKQKTIITKEIVTLLETKWSARFLKRVDTSEISTLKARDKTSHALRDVLKSMEHTLDREKSHQLVVDQMEVVAANLPEGESMNLVPFVLDNPKFAKHAVFLISDYFCKKGELEGPVSILHASRHGPHQLKLLDDEHKTDQWDRIQRILSRPPRPSWLCGMSPKCQSRHPV